MPHHVGGPFSALELSVASCHWAEATSAAVPIALKSRVEQGGDDEVEGIFLQVVDFFPHVADEVPFDANDHVQVGRLKTVGDLPVQMPI